MNTNDKKDKIKAIADYIERMMETSPENLGDDKIYLKAAKDALENRPRVWQDTMIWVYLLAVLIFEVRLISGFYSRTSTNKRI